MNDKFNEFKNWILNQGVEISSKENPFQCMDLAYEWIFYLNYPKSTIQHLFAYEVYTNPNPNTQDYFDIIPNSADFIPIVGDLAVFDKTASNVAGHTSICTGVGNVASFQSLDQNWAGVQKATLVTHNYTNPKLLGVLRPKVLLSLNPEITDQTKIPQIEDREVQSIKSELLDLRRDNTNLRAENETLKQNQLKPFTKPKAIHFFEIAKLEEAE